MSLLSRHTASEKSMRRIFFAAPCAWTASAPVLSKRLVCQKTVSAAVALAVAVAVAVAGALALAVAVALAFAVSQAAAVAVAVAVP